MSQLHATVRHGLFLVLVGLLLGVGSSRAQTANQSLAVGDTLPFLKVQEWLQGDPIENWQEGHYYLIDLWATWCTPCLASMPLLQSLQDRYRGDGLVVIGVTSEDKWGNELSAVKKFVASRKNRIKYRLAWLPASISSDKKLQGIFVHEWMQRLGTMSLPKAFLVDGRGRLLWVGNPHRVEPRIQALLAGNFDMAQARREFQESRVAKDLRSRFDQAVEAQQWDEAAALARRLLTDYADVADPKLFTGLALKLTKAEGEVPTPLFDLAVQAAQLAVSATRFEAPGHLDGLASVLAARGDLVGAALAEMRAIAVSEGKMKIEQQEKLQEYLKASGPQSEEEKHE